MITLCTPRPRKNPPPTSCPEVPAPTIVLSEATSTSLPFGLIEIVAATTMTYGSEALAYFSRSARVRTVTVFPSRPPYVPFCPSAWTDAKPSALALAQAGAGAAAALCCASSPNTPKAVP